MLKCYLDRYKSNELCWKNVDICLSVVKLVSNQFITPKILQDFDNAILLNDNVDLDNDDPDNVHHPILL